MTNILITGADSKRLIRKWLDKNIKPAFSFAGFVRRAPFCMSGFHASHDVLPQIVNIFKGEISVIGISQLWNQYDLIERRDKYGENDIPVGLTGWAQINGRDFRLIQTTKIS